MPRYRKLHTKTLESLDVNDMPDDFTRLMWILLPLALCSEGRGLNNASWLKSKLFPLRDDVTTAQVAQGFAWFVDRGMVVPYEVEGRSYFHVPTWQKYQGNTEKEAASEYPAPPDELRINSGPAQELRERKSASDSYSYTYTSSDASSSTPGADAPDPHDDDAFGDDDAEPEPKDQETLVNAAVAALLERNWNAGEKKAAEFVRQHGAQYIVDMCDHAKRVGLEAGWIRAEAGSFTPGQRWESAKERRDRLKGKSLSSPTAGILDSLERWM